MSPTYGKIVIASAISFVGASLFLIYRLHKKIECLESENKDLKGRSSRINTKIQLDEKKVFDTLNVSDFEGSAYMCRCFKSEKWPRCDGSHAKHNEVTGDNVGPLCVKK